MIQWPRLHAPNAGGPGLIPGQGTRFHMPQLKISHSHATIKTLLRSFNGPEPGSLESMIRKVKERKRLIFLGLHRKPIKPLHGACSVHGGLRHPLDGGEGAESLLERVLEARAG